MNMKYYPVIGLEVHVELSTKSKMFCSCSANHFGVKPNTNTCPTCLGLPGALPFANQEAIESTILFGLAFGCTISNFSKFDRKHYFYPDLPKAFQTSQYDLPLCLKGHWEDTKSKVEITRIHLEEDTGKLVHKKIDGKNYSLIDFNRSGVPLMELVTEPDFTDVDSVVEFLKEVQKVVRYLGISDADMEKGSMRLEANVSVRTDDDAKKNILPDFKIELKNINSFRFMKKAVEAEIERQGKLLNEGKKIKQETRGYDEIKGTTFSQRSKEEAKDYRYFPEPDLPPMRFTDNEIDDLKLKLPELPWEKFNRFAKEYLLPENYCEYLTNDSILADYFEKAVLFDKKSEFGPKTIAGVIVNQKLHEKFPEPAGLIAYLVKTMSVEFASSKEIDIAVDSAISNNPQAVTDYKSGKVEVIGFMIGQVQKELKGKGDPTLVREKLREKLREN